MRIVVVCVGRLRGPPFADDVAHYERLLRRFAQIEWAEVREAGGDPKHKAVTLAKEASAVTRRIPEAAFVCVLDRAGTAYSSSDLAAFLEERRSSGRDLCFVIGGPLGLADEVKEKAQLRMSLGSLTLPHQLARVVLLEQLFRAHKILAREPYHY